MPFTFIRSSTFLNPPLFWRYSTMRWAALWPMPGSDSRSAAVAVFRLTTASGLARCGRGLLGRDRQRRSGREGEKQTQNGDSADHHTPPGKGGGRDAPRIPARPAVIPRPRLERRSGSRGLGSRTAWLEATARPAWEQQPAVAASCCEKTRRAVSVRVGARRHRRRNGRPDDTSGCQADRRRRNHRNRGCRESADRRGRDPATSRAGRDTSRWCGRGRPRSDTAARSRAASGPARCPRANRARRRRLGSTWIGAFEDPISLASVSASWLMEILRPVATLITRPATSGAVAARSTPSTTLST